MVAEKKRVSFRGGRNRREGRPLPLVVGVGDAPDFGSTGEELRHDVDAQDPTHC